MYVILAKQEHELAHSFNYSKEASHDRIDVTQKKTWLLALVAVVATFSFATPAFADDGGPGGLGSGNQIYTPSAQAQAFLQEKQNLANELTLAFNGKIAMATYQKDLQAFYQKHGFKNSTVPSAYTASMAQPYCTGYCPPVSRTLNLTQIAQTQPYYCGPGSAEMILNYLGYNTSQPTLAGTSYLQTDEYGGTNYGGNVMAPTLNNLGHTGGFYAQQNIIGLSAFESDMVDDIYNYWPITVAVHESSTYELNPTENGWYHWYVVRGYTNSGAYTNYADPASGIWSVPQYGTTPSSNVYGMMNGYGYIW